MCGDLLDAGALAALVHGVDCVFHAGGQLEGSPDAISRSLVDGTAAVIAASAATRLVHLSSLVVLDTTSPDFELDTSAKLEPRADRRGVYTQAKVAAEALARAAASKQDVVIVRPGLVITAGRNAMPPSVALRVGPFWIPVGPTDAELPVIGADAVAVGLIAAAREAASGAVVHLVGAARVSRRALFDRLQNDNSGGALLPVGSLVLGTAIAMMAVSDAAYRVVAAGRPHRWSSPPIAS